MIRNLFIFSTLAIAFFISSCVSVKVGPAPTRKSSEMTYTEPTKPFDEIKSGAADEAWISGKTGNTISYLSECENSSDPSLQQLESDSLSALGTLNVESSTPGTFNGRESLTTIATGEVDGIPVKIKLLIFKKNNCNYTLSYGGVSKKFTTETSYFDAFVGSFKVP